MQCKECGEEAEDPRLRYCEGCGAKMPEAPPGTPIRRRSSTAAVEQVSTSGVRRRSATARKASVDSEPSEDTDPGLRVAPDDVEPELPPYEGPAWLRHVPGHSPTVLGLGLVGLAVVLSILPFFGGVGPLWTLVVVAGGVAVAARELRQAGEPSPMVDWVPASLEHPRVPVVYAALLGALAVRMLYPSLTALLWVGGAALVLQDQYRKVYAEHFSHLFDWRALTRGLALVTLVGVALSVGSLYLRWEKVGGATSASSSFKSGVPVPAGPPELRVMEGPRPTDDSVYADFEGSVGAGWNQFLALELELLLLAVLALLALNPEVERPAWLRFVPAGVVGLSLVWGLLHLKLMVGPILFLVGCVAVGVGAVRQALAREG